MSRIVKFIFRVTVLAVVAFLAFTIFANLPPPQQDVTVQIPLNAGE